MSQARFQKQQREKARREKAAAKWARREERRNAEEPGKQPVDPSEQADVLAQLAQLHRRFEANEISFDDFTVIKEELTARLEVD